MRILLAVVVCATLLAGCVSTVVVGRSVTGAEVLNPLAAVQLDGPAVAICSDGADVVVLEVSGTRLVVLDSLLQPGDTIPLTERLTAARGVLADRFYYYVYDDRALYRALKDRLRLDLWLSNVRVAGLAPYATGEMLVCDDERNLVWYKSLFGEGGRFLDPTAVADPGPIVALPGGRFCVLDGGYRLVFFNRARVISGSVRLAEQYDLMAADASGVLYLGRRGSNVVVLTDGKRQVFCELEEADGPIGFAVLTGPGSDSGTTPVVRLAVLDSGSRILLYRPPRLDRPAR
ncbi:MAG: hypothetical protein ABIL25_09800 [candidate division WOR-3 bacterium]